MKRYVINTYIGILAITLVGGLATWLIVQTAVAADAFGGYADLPQDFENPGRVVPTHR
jgi:hypothetical protein